MAETLQNSISPGTAEGIAGLAINLLEPERAARATERACFHCGEPCNENTFARAEKTFCCQGCLLVHEILAENGLGHFYELNRYPGVRVRASASPENREFLDDPLLQRGLLDFTDGKTSRVTLKIPAIHCVACVWLLENLFRLRAGIGRCQVNFTRRELSITFSPPTLKLSQLVRLLEDIGYKPQLTLGELDPSPRTDPARKKQWLQVGIAGFAFGNIMLLSLPAYLGLDSVSGPLFTAVFGYLSLLLALPVLIYSASDYWRSALASVRQRVLTLDVPIAVGLAALYLQSLYEIGGGRGEGYLDSLCGLIFFLLCGRVFQHKTHERLAFDRDYRSFFPLSTVRKTPGRDAPPGRPPAHRNDKLGSPSLPEDLGEERISLSSIKVGDRLLLRNAEMIPCDATLVSRSALIDYSFVTGESEPVTKAAGEHLYAGGQQIGGAIEIEAVKAVSQSYLASLWDHEAFQKNSAHDLNTLTNRYSRRFTRIVIGVAAGAGLFWAASGDLSRGLKAFTSVLIVACPCALALAAPFALGTAQRLLARMQVFLRNSLVLERMAQVATIVFDKTGTLTAPQATELSFYAPANEEAGLSLDEQCWIGALVRQSTHPHSVRISGSLQATPAAGVTAYAEIPGCGIEATVSDHHVKLGSRTWFRNSGIAVPDSEFRPGAVVCVAIAGQYRGAFVLSTPVREQTKEALELLASSQELALLSGDNENERDRFRGLFPANARLHFNQSPHDKLAFIRSLQEAGQTVMMVGDGLNDAGALKQSDVGVAVIEKTGAFSPASDVILRADKLTSLPQILRFARQATRIVRLSFGVSALYNLVGISIASAGILSPLICAVLMPLSSVSVVLFACGMTTLAARKAGLNAGAVKPVVSRV